MLQLVVKLKKIILSSKAGFCSPPENELLLYKNIIMLKNLNKKKLEKLSINSKKYYNQNFSNYIITKKIQKNINLIL